MSEPTELYRRHRPNRWADVVGQELAIKPLREKLSEGTLPHCLVLAGGTGTGKTTIARILAKKLQCHPKDFNEMNCAGEARGIDTIRDLKFAIRRVPLLKDGCRIWLLDEAHCLTKDAQQAALKLFEDIPDHVYFMLATNEPDRLLPTVRGRCFPVMLKPITRPVMVELIKRVADKEGREVSDAVCERIAEVVNGSAREALVMLEQALAFTDEADQLNAVVPQGTKRDSFEIVRLLLWKKGTWANVAKVISELGDQNWEQLRQAVLTCASNEMLKCGDGVGGAAQILNEFKEPWDRVGRAGLLLACFSVLKYRK